VAEGSGATSWVIESNNGCSCPVSDPTGWVSEDTFTAHPLFSRGPHNTGRPPVTATRAPEM
jgi:hypothetical protein